jgi:ADP-heptose:LPS heptosyltransferase
VPHALSCRDLPVERWAVVARIERATGHRVVITGSCEDVDRAVEIAERAGIERTQGVAGRTDLRELAALVTSAGRAFRSRETGGCLAGVTLCQL